LHIFQYSLKRILLFILYKEYLRTRQERKGVTSTPLFGGSGGKQSETL